MTVCPRCYQDVATSGRCPSCGFDVPVEWLTSVQLAIAITGARTAGKSVLIGVMMDQFEYFLSQRHQSFLNPLGTTRARFDEKYRDPLYQQRNLLRPTPPAEKEAIEPLLWSFDYADQRICLSITDAAGEDFESLAPTDARFRYLGFADLIVALVDPLKVPGVSAVLEGVVTVPRGSGHDLDVLRAVLAAREAHRQQDAPDQVLGIVLSKFDVLQRMRDLSASPWQSIMNRPGSTLQRDPSMVSAYSDRDDADLLQHELHGLLGLLGAHMLLAAAAEARVPYRLFATSALGAEPNASTIGRGGIIPFRVLDVLQAALGKKLGVR